MKNKKIKRHKLRHTKMEKLFLFLNIKCFICSLIRRRSKLSHSCLRRTLRSKWGSSNRCMWFQCRGFFPTYLKKLSSLCSTKSPNLHSRPNTVRSNSLLACPCTCIDDAPWLGTESEQWREELPKWGFEVSSQYLYIYLSTQISI